MTLPSSPEIYPFKTLDPRLFSLVCEEFHFSPMEKFENFPTLEYLSARFGFLRSPQDPSSVLPPVLGLEEMCKIAAHYFLKIFDHAHCPSHNLGKRLKLSLALCLTFLRYNQVQINAPEIEVFQMALDFGYEELTESEFADFLFQNAASPCLQAQWNWPMDLKQPQTS